MIFQVCVPKVSGENLGVTDVIGIGFVLGIEIPASDPPVAVIETFDMGTSNSIIAVIGYASGIKERITRGRSIFLLAAAR